MLRDVALAIVGRSLETGRIPLYICAGMMGHSFPKRESLNLVTMFQAVHCTLTNILCARNEIQVMGVEYIPDSVVKSGRIYKHNFRTKDGKEFYLTEVVKHNPDSSCGLLSRCILERNTKGCLLCSFDTKKDDIECELCGGDKLKPYLMSKGFASFGEVGWKIFAESIETKHMFLMMTMTKFFQRFLKEDSYVRRWEKGLETIQDTPLFGSFVGERLESVLFGIRRNEE